MKAGPLGRWRLDPVGSLVVLGPPCVATALRFHVELEGRFVVVSSPAAVAPETGGRAPRLALETDVLILLGGTGSGAAWRRCVGLAEERWQRHRDTIAVLDIPAGPARVERARAALGQELWAILNAWGDLIDTDPASTGPSIPAAIESRRRCPTCHC